MYLDVKSKIWELNSKRCAFTVPNAWGPPKSTFGKDTPIGHSPAANVSDLNS